MKTRIIHILLLACFVFYSCDDFIDTTPKDSVIDKIVWEDESYVTLYMNTFYAYISKYGQFDSEQFGHGLTEGLTETLKYGSYVNGNHAGSANGYVFTPEQITPSGSLLHNWTETYKRIRRVNEFLVGLGLYSKFSEESNLLFEAQARFFRGFLYFQLAKRHGGVILYTDLNMGKDKEKSSSEETWNLIAEDLKFAAANLPEEWDSNNYGRITKGAAYAILSRAMLYAERWQEVVDASDEVMKLNYKLETDYAEAWKGNNSESILEHNYQLTGGPNHSFDKTFAPFGDIENLGGNGVPTQEIVESYEKKDGTKVDWSPWHVEGGTTVRPPYEDLEPRFHATIIYNGCKWKDKTMQNSVGGENGRYMGYREDTYTRGRTVTGYYLRKLADENNRDLLADPSTQPWVEIRLAEVYLNRAEAYYRLNNHGKALNDINEIRTRVGLPKKEGLSGKTLFDAIRQERKIELSYEGHLYWDMRRWKLAHIEYNNYRVHGFKISPQGADWKYEYVDCDLQDRKFLEKLYVLPVPVSEMNNNSAITQYDEWK